MADTVKIVSFRHHKNNYPIKGNVIISDSLVEVKTLNQGELYQMTDIIFNNFFKKKPNYGVITQCYYPRNAILFINNEGKLIESIIICFHCDNYKLSSEEICFGDDCSQKIDKLRLFFISMGLSFGTNKDIMQYPGETFGDEFEVVR
jgi:hypothetical protein